MSFPKWHYINKPYVPEGSQLKESDFRAESPNVVTQIKVAIQKVKDGTPQEKPIYLCWLLHLVGDVHQPLHSAEMFSERFPEGDRGGNLVLIRINGGRVQKLHPLWDGLLGKSISWSSIQGTVAEVAQLEKANQGKSMGISSPQPRRTPGPAKVLPPRKSTPTWTGSWTLRTRRKGRARKTFRT